MLIGRVREIGPLATAQGRLHEGERIATLVSLSLTPLHLDEITNVDLTSGQVRVRGHAVLFDSGIYAVMPDDLPDALTLAVCDVCGAPAQVVRLVQEGQQVVVLGAGGKSGMMVLAQARRNLGRSGKLIAVEYAEKSAHAVRKLGYADEVVVCDARNPIETLQTLLPALGDALADLTINCVSVPGTELASILVTRERGLVYFFSMATSFTAAALGAEGFGKDVDMMIGNGYAKGHAELAFALVREERPLYQALMAKL